MSRLATSPSWRGSMPRSGAGRWSSTTRRRSPCRASGRGRGHLVHRSQHEVGRIGNHVEAALRCAAVQPGAVLPERLVMRALLGLHRRRLDGDVPAPCGAGAAAAAQHLPARRLCNSAEPHATTYRHARVPSLAECYVVSPCRAAAAWIRRRPFGRWIST